MPSTHEQTFQQAEQQLASAKYLLDVTYRTIQDPKLLIGVITNIFSSLEQAITTLLIYERSLLLIPNYETDFNSKFTLFRSKVAPRNHIPQEYITLINKLQELTKLHKTSPIEFQRGNKLILCDKDYQLEPLTITNTQEYINQSQRFLDLIAKLAKIKRK